MKYGIGVSVDGIIVCEGFRTADEARAFVDIEIKPAFADCEEKPTIKHHIMLCDERLPDFDGI